MSSGFISENEIAEKRRARQEEWEKVRTADQPLEVPEEEYDHRSLFERLQEQKQRKEFEFEEAHRLKNMIKGLDDDEIEFLDLVDRSKLEEERKKSIEEAREMADFRNKVATLHEKSMEQRLQLELKAKPPPPVQNSGRTSQTKLLAGAVVKKRPAEGQNISPKKQKTELETEKSPKKEKAEKETENSPKKQKTVVPETENTIAEDKETLKSSKRQRDDAEDLRSQPPLQCIGILPGLTSYDHSSDSASSDSECETTEKFDLLGRKIQQKSETTTVAATQ